MNYHDMDDFPSAGYIYYLDEAAVRDYANGLYVPLRCCVLNNDPLDTLS